MLCLQELGYEERHLEKFSVHLPYPSQRNKPVSSSNTRITKGASYLNQKNIKIAMLIMQSEECRVYPPGLVFSGNRSFHRN